ATSPRGSRFTFKCLLPGQIRTRPPCNTSPDCASFTLSALHSLSRRANISVNPSGICCTTTMQPGKSAGNCDNTYCNDCGPPVEIPMAIILVAWRLETDCALERFTGSGSVLVI